MRGLLIAAICLICTAGLAEETPLNLRGLSKQVQKPTVLRIQHVCAEVLTIGFIARARPHQRAGLRKIKKAATTKTTPASLILAPVRSRFDWMKTAQQARLADAEESIREMEDNPNDLTDFGLEFPDGHHPETEIVWTDSKITALWRAIKTRRGKTIIAYALYFTSELTGFHQDLQRRVRIRYPVEIYVFDPQGNEVEVSGSSFPALYQVLPQPGIP